MSPGPERPGPLPDDPRPRHPHRLAGASALRVAVTRPRPLTGVDRLAGALADGGARVLVRPLLRFLPPRDPTALGEVAAELVRVAARSLHPQRGEDAAGDAASLEADGPGDGRDQGEGAVWLVVTSRNTIPPLREELDRHGATLQALSGPGIRVAAVGSGTARALADAGLPPDLMPERFTGEDLLEALRDELGDTIRGARILIPRAEKARDVLPEGLERAGADVRVAPAYRVDADPVEAARLAGEIREGEVDVVTFTSGSAVAALGKAWTEAGGVDWPRTVRIAVIGPVTEAAVEAEGWPRALCPATSTLEALAAAVLGLHGTGSG